jgi:hypothetical protein
MHEGKIERTLREHLAAHPDEAFSTDDLCMVCYEPPIERKHRVAVLRAIDKVLASLPDRRSRRAILSPGSMLVFSNAASVPSTAKADHKRHYLDWPQANVPVQWDEPKRLADAERAVVEHAVMRHGTDDQRQQLTDRRAAEQRLHVAKPSYAAAVSRNPIGVLLSSSRMASDNISELAEKARRLMQENDPDAIRDGLGEIASAHDGIARETKDPMATIRERLDA